MAKPCTNDQPCGRFGEKGAHSLVCQKLAQQRGYRETVKGVYRDVMAKHVATREGPTTLKQLPTGELLIARSDAPPVVIGAGGKIERLDLSPGKAHCTGRRQACGCGEVALVPEAWAPGGEAENGWEDKDGVVHRYAKRCLPPKGDEQALAPRRRPPGPVTGMAESFARLALEAQEDRKKHAAGTWEDGEAAGRFNAYRSAAARAANVAGGGDDVG